MLIEVAEGTYSSKLLDTTLPLFLCNHSWRQRNKAALIFALP